jgi:aldehyde:ferredoxin oxidoreductase
MQPILKVDLTHARFETIPIPDEWVVDYLGGASLAARLLYEYLLPELDPYQPDAPLIFLNGPLSGTAGPAVGRFVVCGRSPATKLWGEANCGGFWGPELRMAGYDGLWITGRSDRPVYLFIRDDQVSIRDAAQLWGQDTYTTQAMVENELGAGKVRVATIGAAGERRIPFALILTDHGRVAGRTGMGAVMGAKKLKAVAVQGHGQIPVADSARYMPLRSEANRILRNDGVTQVLRQLGTSGVADYCDYLGEMPKKYFREETFPGALEISGANIQETILAGVSTCHACVIACGRVVKLEDGMKRKGPEYETLVGFGPNLWLNDPGFVTRMGELCDRYGMDSISLSNIIGLAFSLFEMGKIGCADTGGLDLTWGNQQAVEALIHQTVRQEGLGAIIAQGARELGRHFGVEQAAVEVNGLEVPYHDPRGASGMALVYATSPRGACHNQSDYFLVDFGQVEPDLGLSSFSRHAGAEKAKNVALHQDWRTVFNSLVLCIFSNISPDLLVKLINSACGFDWDIQQMLKVGERGWNLKRSINNRLGLTAKNDRLPEQLLRPYANAQNTQGFYPDIQDMLAAYYTARQWDPTTGYPTREKLNELGLDWVGKDLWQDQMTPGDLK